MSGLPWENRAGPEGQVVAASTASAEIVAVGVHLKTASPLLSSP